MNTTDETTPPPPPPSPDPPPARRLVRTPDDKVFTGLCGGLGRYFGVDPVIFRIGFVVLTLAGGTGLLLYLAGWLLVPEAGTGVTEAQRLVKGRRPNIVLLVLAVIGAAVVLDQIDDDGGDFIVALTLIGVGAAVLWARRNNATVAGPPGPAGGASPPAPQPVDAPPPSAPAIADAVATDAVPTAPPPPAAMAAARPRSSIVPVTLSLVAIGAGVLALVGASLTVILAAALLGIGVGLLVGAWRGRARALIPFGVLIIPALLAASVVDVPLRGGIGERSYRPVGVSEVDSPYRLALGELELDLSRLDLSGGTLRVVASAGIGELRVTVPRDAPVEVLAHAGAGEVRVFGRTWTGTDVDERVVSPGGGGGGGGRLVVRAEVGIGEVEVRRAAA